MTDIEYIHKSWDEFHCDCRTLAKKLIKQYDMKKIKGIIAISRGGIIPSGILAKELSIRNIDTICIESYTEESRKEDLIIIKSPTIDNEGENYIFIDDLIDTGRTIKYIKEKFPKSIIVTIYAKPLARKLVDLYVKPIKQYLWLLFPWDLELKKAKPLITEEETLLKAS